jgi:hypothetical protein
MWSGSFLLENRVLNCKWGKYAVMMQQYWLCSVGLAWSSPIVIRLLACLPLMLACYQGTCFSRYSSSTYANLIFLSIAHILHKHKISQAVRIYSMYVRKCQPGTPTTVDTYWTGRYFELHCRTVTDPADCWDSVSNAVEQIEPGIYVSSQHYCPSASPNPRRVSVIRWIDQFEARFLFPCDHGILCSLFCTAVQI